MSKKSFLLACLLFAFGSSAALSQQHSTLYSFDENSKCGYVDKSGKIVIEPRFDSCWGFSEGFAGVIVKGNLGFIDTTGAYLVEPIFNYDLVSFSEGFAQVDTGDFGDGTQQKGFVDTNGQTYFFPSFNTLYDFSEGLAVFQKGGRWGYVDRQMNIAIEPRFRYASSFADGFAHVRDENDDYFYIDKSGQKAIDRAGSAFSEGLAWFEVENKYTGSRYGFFDTSGRTVIDAKFSRVDFFYEGLCAAQDRKTDKWGFIDRTGKFVIKPQFDDAERFNEGFGQVAIKEKWGYVDRTGKIVIPLKYDSVEYFEGGVGNVKIGDDWHLIDTKGKFLLKPGKLSF